MKSFQFSTLLMCVMALTFGFSYLAMATHVDDDVGVNPGPEADELNEDRPGAPWITYWWMLDGQITGTGGFAASAPIDWLSEGSGGAITQESISTLAGLTASQGSTINLPNNGGNLGWGVFTIDPADGNNMSTIYGFADESDFDTYAIIVIDSPNDRDTVMQPAHDDHVQIWINGHKFYNNSRWTGGATTVDWDIEISFNKGLNVLLYRTGESGGSDYFNLAFQDSDSDLTLYPDDSGAFFDAISTAVEPGGKLPSIWGDIKRQNR